MINKVLWKAMLTPVPSRMIVHRWAVKHRFLFPLYSIPVCPISDLSILLYYCSILLPTNTFNSFPWHYISPWPSHMLASLMDVTVTEWAQGIYPSLGFTNPDLDTRASTYDHWNTWKTPFRLPELSVATNAIKAAADDSDYVWSHSLRNKILCFSVYCNAELVTWSHHNYWCWVCPSCPTWPHSQLT